MLTIAVAIAASALIVGVLLGAVFGAITYYILAALRAPHPIPGLAAAAVFLLTFFAYSGVA